MHEPAPELLKLPAKKEKARKVPVDDTGFWTEFLLTLEDDNLPLMLLIRDVLPKYEDLKLSLVYCEDDELIYHFALENKIAKRISGLVSTHCDKTIGVRVLLEGDKKTQQRERSSRTDDSEIKKWDNLIKENFMANFPDGNVKWEERK